MAAKNNKILSHRTHRLAGDQGSADWLPAVPVAATPRHRATPGPRGGELRMLLVAGVGDFHVDLGENDRRAGSTVVGGRGLGRQDDGRRLEKTLGGAQLQKEG